MAGNRPGRGRAGRQRRAAGRRAEDCPNDPHQLDIRLVDDELELPDLDSMEDENQPYVWNRREL